MSPVSQPAAPTTTRLVMLGPVTLPTLKGEVTEVLGDQLETVGAGVVPGERRPRPLTLRIPIHGDALDADRRTAGLRLRRQLRALMENTPARLQGLYLNWSVDPEQNGWLLVGGGDLKYAAGGIVFGDFEVELSDCYRVASQRTHRPARRLVTVDRRLVETARDIQGTVFSTDFASQIAVAWHFLGVGVSDPVASSTRWPVSTGGVSTKDSASDLQYVAGRPDGEVISYEQAEVDLNRAVVRLYDNHGTAVEADWEPVFGPDQPLSGVPILENAVCRVVLDAATGLIDIYTWATSVWVLNATVSSAGYGSSYIYRVRVVEWTTERAVLAVTSVSATGTPRFDMFIALQRGWTGPRIENYAANQAGSSQAAAIGVYTKSAGDATIQRSTGGATAIASGTSIGAFTGLQPWAVLLGPGTDLAVHLAVVQEAVNLRGSVLSSREGVLLEANNYVSVTLGIGARASAVADATSLGQRNLIDARAVPECVARGAESQ